ncbi:hypothetical protein LMH87_007157 [Akanthomyces muscarius]|uniref:Uncharacterized protein n=1 Tax=Akanthomyces muscarius TaxID=2231603 RepID=A0A9W8QSJ7_AKAMU|nr:hypothetical protein LMH87_007157 [Akanthomyces muscarius]KAJ4165527.1 hypothetical protein LMH87_007157 [Akanthomyces muscarius]
MLIIFKGSVPRDGTQWPAHRPPNLATTSYDELFCPQDHHPCKPARHHHAASRARFSAPRRIALANTGASHPTETAKTASLYPHSQMITGV